MRIRKQSIKQRHAGTFAVKRTAPPSARTVIAAIPREVAAVLIIGDNATPLRDDG